MTKKNHRTKKIIRTAFLDCLEKKNFHQLTVIDIANEAGINRGTFYFHYSDKYALLDEFEAEIIDGIKTAIVEAKKMNINNEGITNTQYSDDKETYDSISNVVAFLYKNAQLVKGIFSSDGLPECVKKIKQNYANLIFQNLFLNQGNEEETGYYYIPFMVSGLVGIIEQWATNGFKESPTYITDIICSLFQNCIPILNSFVKVTS